MENNKITEVDRSEVRTLMFHTSQALLFMLILFLVIVKPVWMYNGLTVFIIGVIGVHLFTKEGRSFLVKHAGKTDTLFKTMLIAVAGSVVSYVSFIAIKKCIILYTNFGYVGKYVVGTLIIAIVLLIPKILKEEIEEENKNETK